MRHVAPRHRFASYMPSQRFSRGPVPAKAAVVATMLLTLLLLLNGSESTAVQTSNAVQTSSPADLRAAVPPQDLNTPRTFPEIKTLEQWEARRKLLREQILVSCGLAPLPPRTPLHPHVFGRVQRDGYTIEKVYFQTYPGFYLAGNLYRPLETHTVLHPGILVAHGHWPDGRMANNDDGSIPARAITFARQGAVAFTYDMVGYNDTRQVTHQFAGDREHWLWGVSLMGLQTWNSMRALDFLCTLPDVDQSRLAITGESGGGTQTMMLGALDDRLAAVGPCVMVSHTMQGGCLCENAPGLRIEMSNMELAAMAAPRPQIMVGATGDWTRTMMEVEGPAVQHIYDLYGHPDRLKYVRFNFNHNINRTSRNAVYQFFGKWLLGDGPNVDRSEPPYHMESPADLRVFPDNQPLPKDAKDAASLTRFLEESANADLKKHWPHSRHSLESFQQFYRPIWRDTLALDLPSEVTASPPENGLIHLSRPGRGDSVPVRIFRPEGTNRIPFLVIADDRGMAPYLNADGTPAAAVTTAVRGGVGVLLLDAFLTGSRSNPSAEAARKLPFNQYFTTYNRTDLQNRVQDLVTAVAYLRGRPDAGHLDLIGVNRAGPWALLAAPVADATVADMAALGDSSDSVLCQDEWWTPGLRKLGDFRTAVALAAPHPLLLVHAQADLLASAREVYHAVGADSSLTSGDSSPDGVLAWARSSSGHA